MHMAAAAVINAAWDLKGRASRAAGLEAAGRPQPRAGRVARRLPLPARRPDRGRSARAAPQSADGQGGTRAAAAAVRLPGLHHHSRLAGIHRREAGPAQHRGPRRRLRHDQAEGRREQCGRPAAPAGGPGGGRAGPAHRHRRQPGLGAARGHQPGAGAGGVRALLDRGAHLARRRARPCGHSQGRESRYGSPPASTSRTRSCSSSCCRPGRSTLSKSTPAALAASTRTWRFCCSPQSSAFRSARTPVASGCARSFSTWRCSTSWRSAVRPMDRMIEYVDHLHEHFTHPVVIRRGHYVAPLSPGMSARMHDTSIADYTFPDGSAWQGSLALPTSAAGGLNPSPT